MDLLTVYTYFSLISFREILVFAALFLTVRWFLTKRHGDHDEPSKLGHIPLPPSPRGLPFFGNMFSLRTNLRPILKKWTAELGGIFNVRIGPSVNMVVLSDLDLMQEAFLHQGDNFSGRAAFPLNDMAVGNRGSILFETAGRWRTTRRVGMQALRNFGVGKSSMENRIKAECEVLVNYFKEREGIPINPEVPLFNSVANIICSILIGHRYKHTDSEFQAFVYNLKTVNGNFAITSLGNAFPLLYYTPLYTQLRVPYTGLLSMVQGHVEDHRRQSETVTEIRDVVDYMCREVKRRREKGLPNDVIEEGREWRGILDFFGAGIITTGDVLTWSIQLLAYYQDVLKECQNEIDDVIGSGRNPVYADKDNMPFVTATLQEVMRYRPVVPLGLARENEEETILGGYRIPKGSTVIMNIWALHMNPKYWDKPEKFNPRRFLSEDGKTVTWPPALIPFGMGRRVCLGEIQGRMSSFLIFTNILQKFTFRLADESKSVDLDGVFSITLAAQNYRIIVQERPSDE